VTDDKAAGIIKLMQDSATRMSGLIDSVLDFARGRLGGGIALQQISSDSLMPLLELVVAELRTAWPDRIIETDFTIVLTTTPTTQCDMIHMFDCSGWSRPRRQDRSWREEARPKRRTKGARATPKTKSFIMAFEPNVQKLASL
jgi:signal transduction histidine kinase